MAERNSKKKLTHEDKFARKYWCQHARLNSIRGDKRQAKKRMRTIDKKIIKKDLTDE